MAMTTRPRTTNPWLWARIINLLAGIWLVISAFAWPHTGAEKIDTWIVGLWIAAFSLLAMAQPAVRWLNTLAAIWLFVSTLRIAHAQPGTVWNNVIVAIIVFMVSIAGASDDRRVDEHRPVGV